MLDAVFSHCWTREPDAGVTSFCLSFIAVEGSKWRVRLRKLKMWRVWTSCFVLSLAKRGTNDYLLCSFLIILKRHLNKAVLEENYANGFIVHPLHPAVLVTVFEYQHHSVCVCLLLTQAPVPGRLFQMGVAPPRGGDVSRTGYKTRSLQWPSGDKQNWGHIVRQRHCA